VNVSLRAPYAAGVLAGVGPEVLLQHSSREQAPLQDSEVQSSAVHNGTLHFSGDTAAGDKRLLLLFTIVPYSTLQTVQHSTAQNATRTAQYWAQHGTAQHSTV